MRTLPFYKWGFWISGIYDMVLGLGFFLFYKTIFSTFDIVLPESIAYIHLSAAFVFVQGIMYYLVSGNLQRNIDMVKAGVAYKIAYVGLCFYYWNIDALPHPMFGFFGICDVGFLALFLLFLKDYESLPFTATSD
jgi:hypothetical protein